MKKITYIFIALFVISTGVYAQGQMDALRFSQGDMFGTARAMSMGGAFGALGGDQTGVSINPAGIAIYGRNEVVGTFQFMENRAIVGDDNRGRGSFNMPSFGFVGYFPLRSHSVPFINVGLTYNQSQSFNRRVRGMGELNNSLLDFIADRSFGWDDSELGFQFNNQGGTTFDPFQAGAPWLSALAYNAQLMNRGADGHWAAVVPFTEAPFSQINMRERGFVDHFGFTLGTTINNVLSLGASLNVTTVSYRLDSWYDEDFNNGGFTLYNMLTTDGAGIGGRFGLIFKPVHEFRIGISYHTPTRFALRETFEAEIEHNMDSYIANPSGYNVIFSGRFSNEYDLRTPDRWVFSVAGILGDLIISADYEITNFSNMRLLPPANARFNRDPFADDNQFIQEDFRMASTFRLGLDYRITPQFSVRAGYAWMQNPNTDSFQNNGNPAVAGSNTIFMVQGDANMFTAGLGYWFNRNLFLDFALVYRTQTNDLFAFPNILFDNGDLAVDATPFEMRNNSFRGILTLGYRF